MRRIHPGKPRLGPVLAVLAALLAVTTAATATLAARSDGVPQPASVAYSSAPLPGELQASEPDPELTTALIQQDWPKVADLLGADPSLPAAKQFIQAHAYTALNQANDAMCTFLGVSSDESFVAWHEWARDFQARHPQDAVA